MVAVETILEKSQKSEDQTSSFRIAFTPGKGTGSFSTNANRSFSVVARSHSTTLLATSQGNTYQVYTSAASMYLS